MVRSNDFKGDVNVQVMYAGVSRGNHPLMLGRQCSFFATMMCSSAERKKHIFLDIVSLDKNINTQEAIDTALEYKGTRSISQG